MACAGRQALRARSASHAGNQFRLLISVLAVILERSRIITDYYLVASRSEPDPCRSLTLDMQYDRRSCLVETRQYLSDLATGCAPRWMLVYGQENYDDFGAFQHRRRADADFALASARAVSAAIYRRNDRFLQQAPFTILRLADGRLSEGGRFAIARELHGLSPCCAGRFYTTLLRGVEDPAELLEPPWSRTLQSLLRQVNRGPSHLEQVECNAIGPFHARARFR